MPTTVLLTRLGLAASIFSFVLTIYLLYQYRRQKQQVRQLMQDAIKQNEENSLLLERIRSAVQPRFEAVGITINDAINRIDIKVQNNGAAAIVEKVVTSTPDIEFLDDRFFPLRIESNDPFIVTGISKGLPLVQCRYVVQLHYSDTHGNHYLTAIRGEGQQFGINTTRKSG